MFLKILFLSEDVGEHTVLESILKEQFSNVKFIGFRSRIRLLKHLAFDNSFRLMIVECQSSEYDPVDFTKEVMKLVDQSCFLFIGDRSVLERTIVGRLDLSRWNFNIYEKPFSSIRILESIQNILTDNQENETNPIIKVNPKNYFSIGIKNFYLFTSVPYDAFVELSSNKYMKAISKNETYPQHVIKELAARNIRKLFVERSNYIRFLEESMDSAGKLMFQRDISPVKVFQIQVSSTMLVHQYIKNIGVSDAVIKLVEKIIDATSENINSFDNFHDILCMFPFEQRDIAEKSVLVLYICEMLIKSLKWNSEVTRKQLGLASIIHDCFIRHEELTGIGRIGDAEYKKLSVEMKKEFLQHPGKAAALAEQFAGFSNVEFLVEEHHELPDGKGFPDKKKSNKISGVSGAFIVAVNFVHEMAVNGVSQKSINQTMHYFNKNYSVGFFKQILQAFEGSLKSF